MFKNKNNNNNNNKKQNNEEEKKGTVPGCKLGTADRDVTGFTVNAEFS